MQENMKGGRLASLDALRGLDMLFIIGLDQLLRAVASLLPNGQGDWLHHQLGHVPWEGLSAYDLIFPLFVLISGAAMRFSLARIESEGASRARVLVKLWKRALILVLLGCVVNLDFRWGGNLRLASVLGLIGLSCALAGSVALALRHWWQRAAAAAGILAFIGLLQCFGGDMTPSGCINARIDAVLCPGRLHLAVLDPEGPLCILSATGLCLLGMLAGELLARGRGRVATAVRLGGMGLALLALGCLSGPIIKNIWTPAFVLVSAGIGYLLLGLFHALCDGSRGGAAWSYPLRVVGVNALFIYVLTHALPFEEATWRLYGHFSHLLPPAYVGVGGTLFYLALNWMICWELWRRHIVVKI